MFDVWFEVNQLNLIDHRPSENIQALFLRGMSYFFVEIESSSKDLHSGVFGGSVFVAF
jgi:hypothetical protein